MNDGRSDTLEPLSPTQLQFHLEEYKSLRAEIAANTKAAFDAYLYALVSNGGIAAWLLTHRADLTAFPPLIQHVAAAVPLMVTLLALVLTMFHARNIALVAEYLQALEKRVAGSGLGWEGFVGARADFVLGVKFPRRMALNWLLLVGGGVAFAALL